MLLLLCAISLLVFKNATCTGRLLLARTLKIIIIIIIIIRPHRKHSVHKMRS